MKNIAIYPGSFDPFTNGHLDILGRAAVMFEKIIVTIAVNNKKTGVFSGEERIGLIRDAIQNEFWAANVEIDQFTGLLVDYARQKNTKILVRGVRQVADFEYEFRMALANRRLAPDVDTVFLMPNEKHTFISASIVKEIAAWGGDLSSFVPPNVESALHDKYLNS